MVDNREEDEDGEPSRLDRELIEMLNGLRVVLPGVQVLFAFLLTIPFTNRFDALGDVDRALYFVSLVFAALSATLLAAPGVQHRLQFRKHDKEHLLRLANRFAIAGTVAFTVSLGASVWLVTDVLYNAPVAVATSLAIVGVVVVIWYVTPLVRQVQRDAVTKNE